MRGLASVILSPAYINSSLSSSRQHQRHCGLRSLPLNSMLSSFSHDHDLVLLLQPHMTVLVLWQHLPFPRAMCIASGLLDGLAMPFILDVQALLRNFQRQVRSSFLQCCHQKRVQFAFFAGGGRCHSIRCARASGAGVLQGLRSTRRGRLHRRCRVGRLALAYLNRS